jgi:hypothetical protein
MGAGRSLIPNGNSIIEWESYRTRAVPNLPYDPFRMLKRILVRSGVQIDTSLNLHLILSRPAVYIYTVQVIDTIRALGKVCPSRIHNSLINARSLRLARATSSFLLLDFVGNLWVHGYNSFD